MREGNASGVCCSVRNYKHSAPSQCTSSSKRRHECDRYGSHMVSRIAKLLFCFFVVIQQGLARRDKRAHGRERGERRNGRAFP